MQFQKNSRKFRGSIEFEFVRQEKYIRSMNKWNLGKSELLKKQRKYEKMSNEQREIFEVQKEVFKK